MQFNLTINCDNAAFDDGNLFNELQRILDTTNVEYYQRYQELHDINGNIVGKFELVED
jgi:hypothetical protein